MKKIFISLIIIVMAKGAFAEEKGVGLGVILGEPTGISFKTWIDAKTAVDAAAAWSFSENDSFQFHADYLIHPFNIPKPREVRGSIVFYYGIGGRLKLSESDSGNARNEKHDILGIRFPLGISHTLVTAPIELFAEIVPILDIAPDTEADLDAAIGARYYFK